MTPPQTHESRISILTSYIFDLLKDHSADVGIADVWYGDQNKFPNYPAVCVASAEKRRAMGGIPRRSDVTITIYVLIYHGLIQSPQDNEREVIRLTEEIEKILHADETLSGQIITSYISSLEPGVSNKGSDMIRATRLSLSCMTREFLPTPF